MCAYVSSAAAGATSLLFCAISANRERVGGHDFQKEKKATSLVCYCSGKLKEMLAAGNPDKYK